MKPPQVVRQSVKLTILMICVVILVLVLIIPWNSRNSLQERVEQYIGLFDAGRLDEINHQLNGERPFPERIACISAIRHNKRFARDALPFLKNFAKYEHPYIRILLIESLNDLPPDIKDELLLILADDKDKNVRASLEKYLRIQMEASP